MQQDTFYGTLEMAESTWTMNAIKLIESGADRDLSISICAEACNLDHLKLRVLETFQSEEGYELPGSHIITSESEAKISSMDIFLSHIEPSNFPLLDDVWKKQFAKRANDEYDQKHFDADKATAI